MAWKPGTPNSPHKFPLGQNWQGWGARAAPAQQELWVLPKQTQPGPKRSCSTQSQLRCSQSPLQLHQLSTIFKFGLSNFIYFRFSKLSVSRKVGNVPMTHPRAVTPLWAGKQQEKNSIPIKIYQFPKQEDLGFTFLLTLHNIFFSLLELKTFNSAPGSVARKEFGADYFLLNSFPQKALPAPPIPACAGGIPLPKSPHPHPPEGKWTFRTGEKNNPGIYLLSVNNPLSQELGLVPMDHQIFTGKEF